MYSASHPVSTSINGMGSDMIDPSGTINPAALNTTGITRFLLSPPPRTDLRQEFCVASAALPPLRVESSSRAGRSFCYDVEADDLHVASVLPTPSSVPTHDTSPRGVKRSRSPELYGEISHGGDGDDGK